MGLVTSYEGCASTFNVSFCNSKFPFSESANKAIVGVGVGLAAIGVILFLRAKHHASQWTSVAPIPKGFVVRWNFQF
jgi:hypothetical protein